MRITKNEKREIIEDAIAGCNLKGYLRPFVVEYVLGKKGAEAVRRAGYNVKTNGSASSTAWINLQMPHVKAAIDIAYKVLREYMRVTPEMVEEEYARVAFARITDVIEWDQDLGIFKLKSSQGIPPEVASAIKSVTRRDTQYGVVYEVELHDKIRSLDGLAKTLGMFKEQVEHSGTIKTQSTSDLSMYTKEELEEMRAIHERAVLRRNTEGTSSEKS